MSEDHFFVGEYNSEELAKNLNALHVQGHKITHIFQFLYHDNPYFTVVAEKIESTLDAGRKEE